MISPGEYRYSLYQHALYSTFQVGCLREIGSNGEIGIGSIDAKITQSYCQYDQDNRIMVNVSTYCPIPLKRPS